MDAQRYLIEIAEEFQKIKELSEKAVAQIEGKDWFATLDADSNSIAVLMKHLAGNMRSRWTDFLTTDGEQVDRHRDTEFEVGARETREGILELWNAGWNNLFKALQALQPEDLDKTVYIRNEAYSVTRALHRSLSHYACHAGQIALLARHLAGSGWKSLSIPRGESERYLRKSDYLSRF